MSTATPTPPAAPTPPPSRCTDRPDDVPQATLGDSARAYVTRVRGGDVGSLPAVARPGRARRRLLGPPADTFTDAFNFANLIQQGAAGHRHRDGPGLRPAAR